MIQLLRPLNINLVCFCSVMLQEYARHRWKLKNRQRKTSVVSLLDKKQQKLLLGPALAQPVVTVATIFQQPPTKEQLAQELISLGNLFPMSNPHEPNASFSSTSHPQPGVLLSTSLLGFWLERIHLAETLFWNLPVTPLVPELEDWPHFPKQYCPAWKLTRGHRVSEPKMAKQYLLYSILPQDSNYAK